MASASPDQLPPNLHPRPWLLPACVKLEDANSKPHLLRTLKMRQVTNMKALDVNRQTDSQDKCPNIRAATKPRGGSITTATHSLASGRNCIAPNSIGGPQSSMPGDFTCIWGGRNEILGLNDGVSPTDTNQLLEKAGRQFARPLISMTDPVLLNPEKGWPESYLSP